MSYEDDMYDETDVNYDNDRYSKMITAITPWNRMVAVRILSTVANSDPAKSEQSTAMFTGAALE